MTHKICDAWITETGVLKGCDNHNNIKIFSGPFTRIQQKDPGPPFQIQTSSGPVTLVSLEESSFLLPRTKAWIRSLSLSPSVRR